MTGAATMLHVICKRAEHLFLQFQPIFPTLTPPDVYQSLNDYQSLKVGFVNVGFPPCSTQLF